MVELETINLLVQIVGVSAAAIVTVVGVRTYIVSNRRAEEVRARELETRRAQLYMSLMDHWNTKEFSNMRFDSYRMEWTDLDDYSKKYNANNNFESYASYNTFGRSIVGLAELKRRGLIDLDFLDGPMLTDIMNWWAHFGSLEKERWKRGRYAWKRVVPFIMEVVEYHRKNFPMDFDENGDYKSSYVRGGWVKPEEMRHWISELNIQ